MAEFIGKMNFVPARVSAVGDRIAVEVAGLGASDIAAEQAPGVQRWAKQWWAFGPRTLAILFPGEATDRRTVDGVVDEVVYYGDMTYYDVKVPGIDEP